MAAPIMVPTASAVSARRAFFSRPSSSSSLACCATAVSVPDVSSMSIRKKANTAVAIVPPEAPPNDI